MCDANSIMCERAQRFVIALSSAPGVEQRGQSRGDPRNRMVVGECVSIITPCERKHLSQIPRDQRIALRAIPVSIGVASKKESLFFENGITL